MVDKEMNKKVIVALEILVVVLAIFLIITLIQQKSEKNSRNTKVEVSDYNSQMNLSDKLTNINVVPTMQDTISSNSAWCGTFQLAWNDMQNNLVDGDVEFEENNEIVNNLNKQTFTTESISEEYYYQKWGLMNNDLKTEIERDIKNKFNEKSDILNLFNWPQNGEIVKDKYFFYSILRRNFVFETEFSMLENSKFADTENVAYFGINEQTDDSVRAQVEVLYYTDE